MPFKFLKFRFLPRFRKFFSVPRAFQTRIYSLKTFSLRTPLLFFFFFLFVYSFCRLSSTVSFVCSLFLFLSSFFFVFLFLYSFSSLFFVFLLLLVWIAETMGKLCGALSLLLCWSFLLAYCRPMSGHYLAATRLLFGRRHHWVVVRPPLNRCWPLFDQSRPPLNRCPATVAVTIRPITATTWPLFGCFLAAIWPPHCRCSVAPIWPLLGR
mgnify:CR=1 FL=1